LFSHSLKHMQHSLDQWYCGQHYAVYWYAIAKYYACLLQIQNLFTLYFRRSFASWEHHPFKSSAVTTNQLSINCISSILKLSSFGFHLLLLVWDLSLKVLEGSDIEVFRSKFRICFQEGFLFNEHWPKSD